MKMVGKLKLPKEPTKKEKSDKVRRSKDDSAKAKAVKDKEKRAPRNSKRKKIAEARKRSQSSGGHRGGSDSDPLFEDHADVFRLKGKKKVSKDCELAVLAAVSDFFDSAWLACAERFFITSAPVNVSYELRNTWIRIMESEYQDTGIKGKVLNDKINRVFHSDEPPLPLAFDSWSRGAVELLPRVKRESVLDPFLREFDAFGQLLSDRVVSSSSVTTLSTLDFKSEKQIIPPEKPFPSPVDNARILGETEYERSRSPSPAADIPQGDTWNFELDEQVSTNFTPYHTNTTSATSDNRDSLGSNLSDGGKIQDKLLHFLFSTEPFPKDDSVTEIESTANSSRGRSAKSTSTTMGYFSPSQCGGNTGSGVFRLYGETTPDALLRSTNVTQSEDEDSMNEYSREKSDLVVRSAEEHQDIVKVSRKVLRKKANDSEDELEVHPLFQDVEHTPRPQSTTKSIHRMPDAWRRDPYSDNRLDEVASTKEFTTRRLLNLHGRFRRQALRSIAARIKAAEGSRPRRTSSTVGDSKSASSLGSGTKGRRKSDRNKSIPHSVSNQSMSMRSKSTRGESQVYFVNRHSVKGTVSAPQLFTLKKGPVHKQQKFPRNVESKRTQRSFGRNKSQSPHNTKRGQTNSNRSIGRGQSQSPHSPKRFNATTNRNLQSDKSRSLHYTPSHRNFARDKSKSPHNVKKDNVPSKWNISTRDNARSSRSLTSSRKFMAMGNVRSSNKTDFIANAGKSEGYKRQATNNQFQFASENRRKFVPGSIELQGKPWKKVPQEEPCDCASTTSDGSIQASLERVR